ncbi:hypothetical protein ACFFSH_39325 [Streptomyces filamentosus]|uniref:Uncharacterized protein n=1 Tax=Streptomyces filamentosus TaxID=67294 RepID=A0A919EQ09_STRFL|nr:hypothetical protein [Streptomyces filamentosus]GHG15320.1 hypothetical protein GCM10017667_56070 [Streptomyces filamentosus]
MTDRPRLDQLTDDMLDQLYATIQRLNRRAQEAESKVACYQRAVAQWDVNERGTYIPHASLAAIGRAAGTDILGSVRHLRHFTRVEQAETAIARVRALHAPGWDWSWKPFGCEHHGAHAQPCAHCGVCSPCPTLTVLDTTA